MRGDGERAESASLCDVLTLAGRLAWAADPASSSRAQRRRRLRRARPGTAARRRILARARRTSGRTSRRPACSSGPW